MPKRNFFDQTRVSETLGKKCVADKSLGARCFARIHIGPAAVAGSVNHKARLLSRKMPAKKIESSVIQILSGQGVEGKAALLQCGSKC
jgi:hypothetical protein